MRPRRDGTEPRHIAVAAALLLMASAAACSEEPARSTTGNGDAAIPTTGPSPSCELETEDVCTEEGLGEALDSADNEIDPAAALAAGCANVIAVFVEPTGDTFRFDVTVRSADTGPDKFADAWEIRAPDGTVLDVRELLHDHVNEQPFTRSLSGVEISSAITEVTIAARDSEVGFCGVEAVVAVPHG